MPHKVVEKQVFEQIQKEIENHLAAIQEANVYRLDRDRDGFKAFLRGLRSMLDAVRRRKDSSLLTCTEEGTRYAYIALGRQMMAQEIIESFEDAEKWEAYHRDEIAKLERERDGLSQLPTA